MKLENKIKEAMKLQERELFIYQPIPNYDNVWLIANNMRDNLFDKFELIEIIEHYIGKDNQLVKIVDSENFHKMAINKVLRTLKKDGTKRLFLLELMKKIKACDDWYDRMLIHTDSSDDYNYLRSRNCFPNKNLIIKL